MNAQKNPDQFSQTRARALIKKVFVHACVKRQTTRGKLHRFRCRVTVPERTGAKKKSSQESRWNASWKRKQKAHLPWGRGDKFLAPVAKND